MSRSNERLFEITLIGAGYEPERADRGGDVEQGHSVPAIRESDLPKIVNTFTTRHLNSNQRSDYDCPLPLMALLRQPLYGAFMTRIIERGAGTIGR